MRRDEPPGHEEGGLTLHLVELEARKLRALAVERPRLRLRLLHRRREGRRQRAGGNARGVARLAEAAAVNLLVAGARAREVVVARAHEAEAEAQRSAGIVEVAQRHGVLRRTGRPVVEGRLGAVSTLAGVEPVHGARPRHGEMRLGQRRGGVGAGLRSAPLALFGRLALCSAALADDLAGAPAAGEVVRRGLRAHGVALCIEEDSAPVAVLLRVSVAGVDLDQRLPVGVVLLARELLVPGGARRRVHTPGGAVGNHDRVVPPLVELPVQLTGSRRGLDAILREIASVHARLAQIEVRALREELREVVVALVARRKDEGADSQRREVHPAPGPLQGAERRDGTRGNQIVLGVRQDDVLVAVVVVGGVADLRPLPAQVGHRVGVARVAGDVVALADRLDRLPPVARRDALGVVVDGPEVEGRAVAREVAGVGRGMRALSLADRKADQKGIEREGRVDVQVSEEDLLGARHADLLGRGAQARRPRGDHPGRARNRRDLSRPLVAAERTPSHGVQAETGQDEQSQQGDDDALQHGRDPLSVLRDVPGTLSRRRIPLVSSRTATPGPPRCISSRTPSDSRP